MSEYKINPKSILGGIGTLRQSHDDLLAALKEMVEADMKSGVPDHYSRTSMARAAIERAEKYLGDN